MFGGSDFPKQGVKSVGVARQYFGALGKIARWQAGVFLAHVGPRGRALADKRLYLPEEWTLRTLTAARRREFRQTGVSNGLRGCLKRKSLAEWYEGEKGVVGVIWEYEPTNLPNRPERPERPGVAIAGAIAASAQIRRPSR